MSDKPNPPKEQKNIHTMSFLVANKPGVLVRIALVFARRGFNIDSLVVSPTVNPHFSRMTITAQGDPATLEQILKQSGKLVDVIHASEHRLEESLEKELALFKVRYKPSTKKEIDKLTRRFHAHEVDLTDSYLIIEQTGSTKEVDEFEALLKKIGIVEMVRTGKVILAKGKEQT